MERLHASRIFKQSLCAHARQQKTSAMWITTAFRDSATAPRPHASARGNPAHVERTLKLVLINKMPLRRFAKPNSAKEAKDVRCLALPHKKKEARRLASRTMWIPRVRLVVWMYRAWTKGSVAAVEVTENALLPAAALCRRPNVLTFMAWVRAIAT